MLILKRSIIFLSLVILVSFNISGQNKNNKNNKTYEKQIKKLKRLKKEIEIEKDRLLEQRKNMSNYNSKKLGFKEREIIYYGVIAFLLIIVVLLFLRREKKLKKNQKQEMQKLQGIMKDLIDEVGKHLGNSPSAENLGNLVLKADKRVKKINNSINNKISSKTNANVNNKEIYKLYNDGMDKVDICKQYGISKGELNFIIKLESLKKKR